MIQYILIAGLFFPSPVYAESTSTPQYIISSKASIEDYITSRAIAYNYRPDITVAIAEAESDLNINAKNASSTASGLFQFINGTFRYYCIEKFEFAKDMSQKNDPFIQTECAVRMLSEGGESHWKESEHVWGQVASRD